MVTNLKFSCYELHSEKKQQKTPTLNDVTDKKKTTTENPEGKRHGQIRETRVKKQTNCTKDIKLAYLFMI